MEDDDLKSDELAGIRNPVGHAAHSVHVSPAGRLSDAVALRNNNNFQLIMWNVSGRDCERSAHFSHGVSLYVTNAP